MGNQCSYGAVLAIGDGIPADSTKLFRIIALVMNLFNRRGRVQFNQISTVYANDGEAVQQLLFEMQPELGLGDCKSCEVKDD